MHRTPICLGNVLNNTSSYLLIMAVSLVWDPRQPISKATLPRFHFGLWRLCPDHSMQLGCGTSTTLLCTQKLLGFSRAYRPSFWTVSRCSFSRHARGCLFCSLEAALLNHQTRKHSLACARGPLPWGKLSSSLSRQRHYSVFNALLLSLSSSSSSSAMHMW